MGRPIRVHVSGGIYHVIMRGNAREPIFFDANDRRQLNQIIADGLARYDCRLHAFCWMTNHIHAIIQVSNRPLSEFMCWSASKYARFVNRKRGRTGHLFERRHKAFLVRDDAYLLGLVKYIHLNPVQARLVSSPEKYVWSSHRAYVGLQKIEWVTTSGILSFFADSISDASIGYREFMRQNPTNQSIDFEHPGDSDTTPITLGGLEMRPRTCLTEKDTHDFLDKLVDEYCATLALSPAELMGVGRQRRAARVRAEISNQAMSKGNCTLNDLARYFGRAPEVISRGIERYCRKAGTRE